MGKRLWLRAIPRECRRRAAAALAKRDAEGFLLWADNQQRMELVCKNWEILQEKGVYEEALLRAFTGPRVNNSNWRPEDLELFFLLADRERLLSCGDPLPGEGPFTIYRGVAGHGKSRRERGLSWTASLERARWFAQRMAFLGDPAVYAVTISREHVLAYSDGRNEQEFIILLPESVEPARVE
jgi:hypothetical protein